MSEPNLFEEMLATYPAERRELARAVYQRFASGESTEFFAQLFLVLDVYAHYAERIPARMISANADSLATLQEMREEIGLIAKTLERRDVNISNHAQKTDEFCKITQAKCNETLARVELMVKNLGEQVDTQAIVDGINTTLESDIDEKIISPFIERTEKLTSEVIPALEKVQEASAEASRSWGQRIWKMALTCGAIVGLSVAALGVGAEYWQMKRHFDNTLADEIRSEKYTLQNNRDAFQNLAAANVPVFVARSSDSGGVPIPRGYCLYIPNAQGADVKDGYGRIFFVCSRPESELKQLLDVQQQQ